MSSLKRFKRKHDYLVCVDSDGCAMNTMNCKHTRCFGPCLVAEWGLEQWREEILRRWNEINLFERTRGVNRFKSLALLLAEVNEQYVAIPGVAALKAWADTAPVLSNEGVRAAAQSASDPDVRRILEKACTWTQAVNAAIEELPEELKVPFPGAAESLAAAHVVADVAVVSSANRDALEAEWAQYGLLAHTDIMLAQDCGSKAHCIAKMLQFGYAPDHVLMVGDAPGDCAAAETNGVFFYPILVNQEEASWAQLRTAALPALLNNAYSSLQASKKLEFYANLGD